MFCMGQFLILYEYSFFIDSCIYIKKAQIYDLSLHFWKRVKWVIILPCINRHLLFFLF